MTIYQELGGADAVRTAVSVFYGRVLDDPTLAPWFEGIDLGRLRSHQRAFLAMALDGPELFVGRDLSDAHAGMEITDEAFSTIIEHLIGVLRDLDLDEQAITIVGERLQRLRPQIVQQLAPS